MHHEPIRVAYNTVVDLVPGLHDPARANQPKPDITLHIGLAAGRDFYTLERGAHGTGYGAIPDVDGLRFSDEQSEAKFPRDLFPPVLQTSFHVDDVVARWKKNLGVHAASLDDPIDEERSAPDVRPSPDAGNFMCGFIYYNSLAHYYHVKEDERPVAFMHVPDLSHDDKKLEMGKEVAVALIKALVQSRKETGVVDVGVQGKGGPAIAAGMDVNFA